MNVLDIDYYDILEKAYLKHKSLIVAFDFDRTKDFNNFVNKSKNKSCELLIHGTRNANIFSILKKGLLIRPSNAAMISGAAYGNGIYHSVHTDKSLGYTGRDNDALFLIQNVHMGNKYTYDGWRSRYRDEFDLTLEELEKRN